MLTERELEARRKSLGSSEIGIIAGHSLYRNATPMSVWESKLFGIHGDSSGAMNAGSYFERGIADWYIDEMGLAGEFVARKMKRVSKSDSPWMSATCDFAITGKPVKDCLPSRLLECKFVGPGMDRHYDLDDPQGVPLMVEDQVRWQMACTGIPGVDVAAYLAGPRELKVWRFDRDVAKEKALIEIGQNFWETYVVAERQPPLDFSDASARQLARRFPSHTEEVVDAPSEAYDLARLYHGAVQLEKQAADIKAATKNALCAMVGWHAGLQAAWGKLNWKYERQGRIDKEALLQYLLKKQGKRKAAKLEERFRKEPRRGFRLSFQKL